MKKHIIINISVFICLLCALATFQVTLKKTAVTSDPESLSFFQTFSDFFLQFYIKKEKDEFIPVTFSESELPLVKVEIEGNTYSLLVDLGFNAQLTLQKSILEKIRKKPYGTVQFIDVLGNDYESQKYLIPEIKIGNITFAEVIVEEENDEYNKNVVIGKYSNFLFRKRKGIIGKSILKRQNIFLDFPHSRMAFIENADSLRKLGCSIENFFAVPFKINSFGIILNIETDLGEKKFMLDSGNTLTVIRASQCKNFECQNDFEDINYYITSKFVLQERNFGEMPLHLMNLTAKMNEIDGILGMNFMHHHAMYIDFRNKILYIGDYDQLAL
jgi:predicted aspartyl protease